MGMYEGEIRGYGIQFGKDCGSNTTTDKIWTMLSLAPILKKDVEMWLSAWKISLDDVTVEDFADFDQDHYTGVPALIARAINERYGHDFIETASDENGYVYLYMSCNMPWKWSDFERNLTEEALANILREYYNMLYDNTLDIGDVSILLFG